MSLIKCILDCIHQNDGYCQLDSIDLVSDTKEKCAYFKLKGVSNGFMQVSDTDNLNIKS